MHTPSSSPEEPPRGEQSEVKGNPVESGSLVGPRFPQLPELPPESRVPLEEFLTRLSETGLVDEKDTSPEAIEHFREIARKGAFPPDGTSFAGCLIKLGKLSDWQTRILRAKDWHWPILLKGDKYQLVDMIREGGMGTVYRAIAPAEGRRQVAIKCLKPQMLAAQEYVYRFQREASIGMHLRDSPYLVPVDELWEEEGTHLLAMPYIDAPTLAKHVEGDHTTKGHGPLDLRRTVSIIHELAMALYHCHSHGIVHRDVKASNIFLSTPVKLADFGIARITDRDLLRDIGETEETQKEFERTLTASDKVFGTAGFMSPQQSKAAHDADIRDDIYSLGCVMYYCLYGKPPFREADLITTISRQRTEPLPPVEKRLVQASGAQGAVVEKIYNELSRIYEHMSHLDREKRYKVPQELCEELTQVIGLLAFHADVGTQRSWIQKILSWRNR